MDKYDLINRITEGEEYPTKEELLKTLANYFTRDEIEELILKYPTKAELSKALRDEFRMIEFPEVQKVEVVNQKETVVNVQPPKVTVETSPTIVNIDTEGLGKKLDEIKKTLEEEEEKPTVENPLPVVLVFDDKEYKAGEGKGNEQIHNWGGGAGSYLIGVEDNTKKLVGEYTLLLDDVTTTSVTYVGKATIGTATSSALWQIKKLDESSTPVTLSVKWAGGGASFNQVWDNRASLSYS